MQFFAFAGRWGGFFASGLDNELAVFSSAKIEVSATLPNVAPSE
jgi:hypothetical protein